MGKIAQKHKRRIDSDPYDDLDYSFIDDLDSDDLAKDIFSTDWENNSRTKYRSDARRIIERRNDMRKLYSLLNDWEADWEEFGERDDW